MLSRVFNARKNVGVVSRNPTKNGAGRVTDGELQKAFFESHGRVDTSASLNVSKVYGLRSVKFSNLSPRSLLRLIIIHHHVSCLVFLSAIA